MSTWTTANIERLKSLHAQGLSSSQIAAELGTSRNAIIGKLTRMNGHAMNPVPQRPGRARNLAERIRMLAKTVQNPLPQQDIFPPAAPELQDLPHESGSTAISLFDISYGQCRWPLNKVNPISEFRFCGAKSEGSWCETHKALGWAKR